MFNLTKPIEIQVSGDKTEKITKLELDFDALTLADLKAAEKVKNMVSDGKAGVMDNSTFSARLDDNLRIGVGWVAAMKANANLTLTDALKLSVADSLRLSETVLTEYFFL